MTTTTHSNVPTGPSDDEQPDPAKTPLPALPSAWTGDPNVPWTYIDGILHLDITPGRNEQPRAPTMVDRLQAGVRELLYKASREMDTTVIGARGEKLTAREAEDHANMLFQQIQMDEEVRKSRRHRRASRLAKISALIFLCVIDFPIMLWLVSSVVNVNWRDPFELPLLISIVLSVLGTAGAAYALYHLGHNARDHKNARGGLDWKGLPASSKLSIVGVGLIMTLIAAVSWFRVYSEGVNSGADELALLLALLVAVVMLIAAALVFWTALRDGSPEQDDLVTYSKIAQHHRRNQRQYEDEAVALLNQCELLKKRD